MTEIMLSLLHIENIAVVASAQVAFGSGLNVMTGETGTGKSIVLDALGAVVGFRTSKELVRTGAAGARVSALFDALSREVMDFLCENGFNNQDNQDNRNDWDGGQLLLSREIHADGRSVCRIAGRPASVSLLRRLGALLLHIHGQNDSQALLDESAHRPLLDRFASLVPASAECASAFDSWRALCRRRQELQIDEAEKARRMEDLRFAVQEIDGAGLAPDEEDWLLSRRRLLRHAERLTEALGDACACLLGDDETEGAASLLSRAQGALGDAAALHGDLSPLHERLIELGYAVGEVGEELSEHLSGLDVSPRALDEVEERLDIIYRLKRKYGSSIMEILRWGETCRAELEALRQSERTLVTLDAECLAAHEKVLDLAESLGAARRAAAEKLSRLVCDELCDLEMQRVRFQVEIKRRRGENALRQDGLDDVFFLLSANPGEPPLPLSRIASGGELSRVMLALCNVLSGQTDVQTMVFDEIDAGVSGRAAGRVAEKLGRLSRERQVLCVTHLPQITAMADIHFRIDKMESQGRVSTQVLRLDEEGRVDELSRLLGGLHITETTKNGAREQIVAAGIFKNRLAN